MKKLLLGSAMLAALVAGPATAADMPVKARPLPPPVIYSWTGFYVGANIGYSWGRASSDWNVFAPHVTGATVCTSPGVPGESAFCATSGGSNKLNGPIGGLQAGYNWQTGNLLAGIETDIQLAGQKGDDLFISAFPTFIAGLNGSMALSQAAKLQWLGTLRGRIGLTADRWLVYGTGGLAYGGVKIEDTATATGAPFGTLGFVCNNGCPFASLGAGSATHTRVGWTAGAGVEGAISGNWTVKLEYLYVDLGRFDTTFATLPSCFGNLTPSLGGSCDNVGVGTATIRTRVTDNIVRVGINYRFGAPLY